MVCVCVCACVCVCVRVCVCVCARAHVHMYCLHVHQNVYECVLVRKLSTFICTLVYTYIHIYKRMQVLLKMGEIGTMSHTYTHTYIHAHAGGTKDG